MLRQAEALKHLVGALMPESRLTQQGTPDCSPET